MRIVKDTILGKLVLGFSVPIILIFFCGIFSIVRINAVNEDYSTLIAENQKLIDKTLDALKIYKAQEIRYAREAAEHVGGKSQIITDVSGSLVNSIKKESVSKQKHISKGIKRDTYLLITALIVILVLAAVICFILARLISQPILDITRKIQAMAGGEWNLTGTSK